MREKLSPSESENVKNVLPLISPIKRVEQKRIKRCALREKRLVVVLVKIFRLAKKGKFSPFFPSRKAKNASSDFSKTLFSAKEKIEGEACLGWNGKRVTKKSFPANELEKNLRKSFSSAKSLKMSLGWLFLTFSYKILLKFFWNHRKVISKSRKIFSPSYKSRRMRIDSPPQSHHSHPSGARPIVFANRKHNQPQRKSVHETRSLCWWPQNLIFSTSTM